MEDRDDESMNDPPMELINDFLDDATVSTDSSSKDMTTVNYDDARREDALFASTSNSTNGPTRSDETEQAEDTERASPSAATAATTATTTATTDKPRQEGEASVNEDSNIRVVSADSPVLGGAKGIPLHQAARDTETEGDCRILDETPGATTDTVTLTTSIDTVEDAVVEDASSESSNGCAFPVEEKDTESCQTEGLASDGIIVEDATDARTETASQKYSTTDATSTSFASVRREDSNSMKKTSVLTLLNGLAKPPPREMVPPSTTSLQQLGEMPSYEPPEGLRSPIETEMPHHYVLQKNMVYFDNVPMYLSQMIIVASNLMGFCMSLATRSHMHLDIVLLGVAFVWSTLPTLLPVGVLLRVKLSSVAVSLWAVKLSCFFVYRAITLRHDTRLDDLLSSPEGSLRFWAFTTTFGIVCALPHSLGTTSSDPGPASFVWLGVLVYLTGLILETVADYQKWTFKQEHSETEFCNTGLWSISQHPNYFGMLLLWIGIFLLNAPSLVQPEYDEHGDFLQRLGRYRRVFLALLGPLVVCASLRAQAAGSLSNAVQLAQAKYGYERNAAYKNYVDNVSFIVPYLWAPALQVQDRSRSKRKTSWRFFPERSTTLTDEVHTSISDWSYFMERLEQSRETAERVLLGDSITPVATDVKPVSTKASVEAPSSVPRKEVSDKQVPHPISSKVSSPRKTPAKPTWMDESVSNPSGTKEDETSKERKDKKVVAVDSKRVAPEKKLENAVSPSTNEIRPWTISGLFSASDAPMPKSKEPDRREERVLKKGRKEPWRLDPDKIFL